MFAILNKTTGEYFGGFDSEGRTLWGSVEKAWHSTEAVARGQASLLVCHGFNAQRKPVSL